MSLTAHPAPAQFFFTLIYYLDLHDVSESSTRMLMVACLSYVLLVGCSRVYCGMHTVTDVVGGLVLGFSILFLWTTYYAQLDYFFYEPTWCTF